VRCPAGIENFITNTGLDPLSNAFLIVGGIIFCETDTGLVLSVVNEHPSGSHSLRDGLAHNANRAFFDH